MTDAKELIARVRLDNAGFGDARIMFGDARIMTEFCTIIEALIKSGFLKCTSARAQAAAPSPAQACRAPFISAEIRR
jgi:hypothetical protein